MAKYKMVGNKKVELTQEELDYWGPIWAINKAARQEEDARVLKVKADEDGAIARLVEKSKTDENARDYLLAIGKQPHEDAVEVPE